MLIVHRAASAGALARGLAEVLTEPLADPFAREVVAVPAKGVERWLAQRLSHVLGARVPGDAADDGVCANVEFPWPSTLLDDALTGASAEHAAALERWAPQRSRWPLLDVVDACDGRDAWFAGLAQHLGAGGEDKGRRAAVVGRVARLFDEYGQSRPAMLRAWAAGRDEQGDGSPLDDDLRWQPELWRRLRAHLATPSPAELLDDACARLRGDPARSGLPARISVFGASRLSPARLAVLSALGAHRDVHLWLHHASPALWDAARSAPVVRRRREDASRASLTNPLLISLSRDVLELQELIARHAPGFSDVHHPSAPGAGRRTLLNRLTADLADDAVPPAPPPLDPADRSVQVHACHGRTRQVEVLREVILGLLAADRTLEPRDVLVMCPDVEAFAPIIAATFSLGSTDDAPHPAARLRVRLADRALRQTNALLAVLSQLLELGTARLTASQVLDLAGTGAVRERFGFDDDDLARLRDWTVGAEVRWGLHREHRSTWQLGDVEAGTWRAGLDRLLVGAAMQGGRERLGDVVPLDDVDSSDLDLAGRLAELVDRLDAAQALMSGRHTVADWMSGLQSAVLALAATPPDAAWQQLQLRSELADLVDCAAGSTAWLGLADVRAVLDGALAGRPTRASFRTGTLTVCTLVPMRSVPHRVVALLGMDDGVFPRQPIRDGDDVLARDPWIGERDPRSEDRQLLLDAICAAGEQLVITYSGADERTGATVPPAVPLGELLDALDRTATGPGGRRVRDAVTTRHPLQPFDARNFTPGALGATGPFSFDPLGYAGAVAAGRPRKEPTPFLAAPLPAPATGDVDLADLQRLLERPARGFLRQRLQVAVTRSRDEPADAMAIELGPLEKWAIGDRLLTERLAGLEPAECIALESRRGALPPGPLGDALLREMGHDVEHLVQASTVERAVAPESRDVDVALPDGTRLTGTVGDVRGDVLLRLTYSNLAAKHRLQVWIDLVALTASQPDRQWRAVAVGRRPSGAKRSVLGPLTATEATSAVVELVELYRAGLRAPLPLPVKSASAYADRRERGSDLPDARAAAAREWLTTRQRPGEQTESENVLVYGPDAPLRVLTGQRPWPDEHGPGWPALESDRFGLLARRLWARLLTAETVVMA